jgi:hypothetical protein
MHEPPQPAVDRITPFAGHPLVVGVVPDLPDLVPLTALSLARATGAPRLLFAYSDPDRIVREEHPDGSVTHEAIDPDGLDEAWRETSSRILDHLTRVLAGTDVPWEFHYLVGRPDRALTHLARAVDAAAFVVGTRGPLVGAGRGLKALHDRLEGSVALHLSHHQHRPVLTVPLTVVDWKETASAWDR